jgi:ABC-type glycerol-3-phosphate transport system permease component
MAVPKTRVASVVGAAVLVVLTYIPFVFVLANSVKSSPQFAAHPFALMWTFHLSNYLLAWKGMARYIGNTVLVAAVAVAIGVPSAAGAGYVFAEGRFRGKEALFYAYVGLLMIPWTLTLIPLFVEIKDFGIYNTWLALILPYAAGSQPLLVFLFRVFFEGIPDELYQSARIDGCSEAGVLLRIVAPLSIPVFITGTLLMCISVWGDYLWPTVALANYHLYTVSAGLETFLGTFGLTSQGIGPAFAAEILTMVPIIALIVVGMKYFVSGVTSGALKA